LNFNIFLILTISLFIVSCGVKAPPQADDNSIIPSYIDLNKVKLSQPMDEQEDLEDKAK